MRKIHLLGIFLILLDFALFAVCVLFEIGITSGEGTTFSQEYSPGFGITIAMPGPDSIEWYVWLPLILIGVAALVCVFWPPRIRQIGKALLFAMAVALMPACAFAGDTKKPADELKTPNRIIVQPKDSVPPPGQMPDCIFWPSPPQAVEAMLKLAEVKPGEVVFDLGSGDGRICIAAAKTYGAHAYGYEIDADLVKKSLENVKKNKVEHRVTIERRDIFKLDLSDADVVTLWLLPYLNGKLIPQLEKMKPGSRIVSLDFDMCDIVKPDKAIEINVPPYKDLPLDHWPQCRKLPIYLWKTPLKMDEERFRKRFPELAGNRK